MADTAEETLTTSKKSKLTIDEDWAVVLLGFVIIFLFLGGMVIPAPAYKWSSAADLMGTVFATDNLVTMLSQFALVFVFALIASVMTNKPVKASLRVFPILYLVSVAALILEGNAAIKAVNLEAVIFSLSIGLIIGNFFRLPEWFRSVLNAEM